MPLSQITLGCMRFTGEHPEENAIATIERAVELGINHIETARCYGNSEERVGKALKQIPAGGPTGEKVDLTGKAKIFFRPYAEPAESPDAEYDLWLCTGRVIEHWHTASMTMRISPLRRAMPNAYVEMSRDDARNLAVQDGEIVRLETRRGQIDLPVWIGGRGDPPAGTVFVPFFDESVFINKVTLDATCPLSKETDFKKCAVKVYKA